ncbi:hypothetical protein GGR50DRAFT_223996 [Xylaria sp. CBS 124048]|nr:hypothetical protein GGR50DRAFT_223996 [Xylaria sp. CBS 124048]
MATEPTPTALPLESFNLAVLPKTTHNITWSPDGELAIASDDSVLVYVPEFSLSPSSSENNNSISNNNDNNTNNNNKPRHPFEGPRQYDEAALRFPVAPLKSPELNRHLFDAVNQEFAGYSFFTGAGSGAITGHGSTMNHTVSLAWSPCGLGRVGRAVLAVHTAAGIVTVYCQGASTSEATGSGARTMRPWMSAWHVGGGFLVPAMEGHIAPDRKEYITSFAWARDTRGMGALMAYLNDEREIVVIWMRTRHEANAPRGHPGTWTVLEVARFAADGPHPVPSDPTHPDYVYHTSSFALSWSPWLRRGDSLTSIISYVAHNYIGFRQITIHNGGGEESLPHIQTSPTDLSGVCLYLSPDAFVVWEDKIWASTGSHICRGVIATPTKVQAFELPFDHTAPIKKHETVTCGTTYPDPNDLSNIQNPITGLVIHPPSFSHNTSAPSYSLVRLSATHDNPSWYQTNLIVPPNPNNPDEPDQTPLWTTEILQTIQHQLPRALAYAQTRQGTQGAGSPEYSEYEDDDDLDSVDLNSDDYYYDSDHSHNSSQSGNSHSNVNSDAGNAHDRALFPGIRGVDTSDQIHLGRVRIWGLASSPGGGTSAVFISQHSNIELGRDTFAGLKCRVLFGRNARILPVDPALSRPPARESEAESRLSTEAKAWEWMYGGGAPVPGYTAPADFILRDRRGLRERFEPVARGLLCVFCDASLAPFSESTSQCRAGHLFETCANTGIPVLAPNVSRTCGVCGMKCLKTDELLKLAPQLRDVIESHISADLCGGCGGKFTS